MSEQVDLFAHRVNEPADQFHPRYESFSAWLDNEAPASQAQKLRNRPKHRRSTGNKRRGVDCVACGQVVDDIVSHLKTHRAGP